MKIVGLVAENFKRIKAAEIHPSGSTVIVGGRNGAGKSSLIDSIEAALGGTKHAPTEPIRQGAKAARIVVETETLVVTRKFTSKGSQLEVKAKDGAVVPSPQALLNTLVGPISFDPLAFARLKPAEQAETLRKLVGLDFTKEDAKRVEAFDKRTEVGRELRRLQGALDKLPEAPVGTPDAEVSVAELAAELDRRRSVNDANEKQRSKLPELRAAAYKLKAEIEELEKKLELARGDYEQITTEGKALSAEVAKLKDEDLDEVRAQIASAETTNANVRAKRQRAQAEAEHDAALAESKRLTDYIAQIDGVKADAAKAAKYPVPGLTVTDEGIQLDGVPFEQASTAQKLKVSVAIGLALNPELKVLLIRDGSSLDADSLAAVAGMADEAGAQVWIEKVSETGHGCTVVIEDGTVAQSEAGAA